MCDQEFVTLTKEMIELFETKRGGYKREVIEAFGVSYPPERGWKQRLIGSRFPKSQWDRMNRQGRLFE